MVLSGSSGGVRMSQGLLPAVEGVGLGGLMNQRKGVYTIVRNDNAIGTGTCIESFPSI